MAQTQKLVAVALALAMCIESAHITVQNARAM